MLASRFISFIVFVMETGRSVAYLLTKFVKQIGRLISKWQRSMKLTRDRGFGFLNLALVTVMTR